MFKYLKIIVFLFLTTNAWGQGAALSGVKGEIAGVKGDLNINPPDVIHWGINLANIDPAGGVTLGLQLTTEQGFTIYRSHLKFGGPAGYELKGVEGPATRKILDPISNKEVEVYDGGDFIVHFEGIEKLTDSDFALSITFLGCTQRICLFPYTESIQVPLYAVGDSAEELKAAQISQTLRSQPNGVNTAGLSSSTDLRGQQMASKVEKGEITGWLLLGVLFLGGLATNLTPCVLPMIPITLRILGRRGKKMVLASSLYALGIVLTYSLLGLMVALGGGLFGAFLGNSWVNLVFAVIFAALAVSMLGFGNFSRLQQMGDRLGDARSHVWSSFLMGAGAGLVGAPCTGPILGGLIAFAAKRPEYSIALFFVYSCGFALPYLFLGLVAGKITRIKAPYWLQLAVKILFSAAMFALVGYFLRIPAYPAFKQLREYWHVIVTVCGILTALALVATFGFNRLAHNRYFTLVPAIVTGLFLFALWQGITVADSTDDQIFLVWQTDEHTALQMAHDLNKPVLVDFWAEWCEACKKMEVSTFADPEVRKILARDWILLKYDLTEESPAQEDVAKRFKVYGLPVLAMLPHDGDMAKLVKFNGYVTAQFLREKLDEYGKEWGHH